MENIQVVLRVRPQNHLEVENNDQEVWQVLNSSTMCVNPEIHGELIKNKKIGFGHKTDFSFNHCFDKYSTNVHVYESQVKRIALSSLQGINGTVFMYGQTGSGKTFTMVGPHEHQQVFSSHGNHSEFMSARGQSNYDFTFASNKTPRTLPTLENERPNESSLRNNSRTFFNRSKSPISTQARRLSDKSPLKKARDIKSPARAETPLSTKIDLDPQQIKSSENFNSSLANFINSHKRSSTLQYPHGQSSTHIQTVVSPQRMDMRPCEMDKLKSHPGNIEGILMLAMKDIFTEIERQPQKKFFLRCSYLEIYTDLVYDLLNSQDKLGEVLTINEDINKEFYIKGATEEIVSSLDEILQKIKKGEANRHYASTAMNHSSSRSHTIFRLYVQSLPAHVDNDQGHYMTESLLNFVDLAGSEKVDIHDSMRYNRREPSTGGSLSPMSTTPTSHKERVRENQHINKSLFFLTQVISLKSQGKQDLFIPYRNSPLTKILRSSLGGNSRTAIILCVNPSISQFEQTMSTLRFGLNAKKIENQVHANIICDAGDEMLRNLLREYEKKIFDMEIEKNKDKSTSEQLLKIIKNLEEQKKLLAERLRNVKKTFPNQIVDLAALNQRHNHKAEDLHYNDVGILHVLVPREDKNRKADYDFEGKYALQSLKSVKEQNAILANKLKEMTQKLEENEREKCELMEALANKDKRLSKKKNAIKHFADKVNEYHVKNDRLRQIVDLYQNKNPEGMKRLPMETLCKLEASQLSLLDSIKLQKALKIVCQALPREMGDNESYRLFKNFLYDITEKDKNVKAHISFGDEIDFEANFFNPTPLHHTSSKRTKLLNEMQKDPNIPVSVGPSENGSVDGSDDSMDRSSSPDDKDPDSFQNYFSSVDKSVRNDGQTERQNGDIDAKLNKLRNSYNKIIELIKKDNLDQLIGQPEAPTMEYGYTGRNLAKVSNNGPFVSRGAPTSSPKLRMEMGEKDFSSPKNLSQELRDANIVNNMGSVESHEIGNSKMMSLLNTFEEKAQTARGREKKKILQKENIRVENINLEVEPNKKPSPLPYSYETGLPSYRTKYAYVNL